MPAKSERLAHNDAMSAPAASPSPVRWDLTTLYSGIDDPAIEAAWKSLRAEAGAFEDKYRGRIDSEDLNAETLASALAEIQHIHQESAKPIIFSHLMFAADTGNPQIGGFLQKQMEKATELSVVLMFFELELQAAPQEAIERALADPRLAEYRHYVHLARAFSPFRLSEPQEIVMEEFANTGSRAFQRLFEEVTSNHIYRLQRPGSSEIESLSQEEVLDFLRSPDRALRQAAADSLTAGLAEMQRVLVFTYNTLLQDKAVEDRLRGYEYPEQGRHLANELEAKTVDLVIGLCKQNYSLVERFYNVKRQILGLDELTHIDRYAPLFPAQEEVSWERAREIVIDSFQTFSPEMARRADEFFSENWIDAEPRPGKRGGAFCMYVTPDTHPYVFLNYLGKMDDVMTLAHELGHGVHASLSRAQNYFNFHGTLPLAELASTFGEMLVFERLVSQATPKDRLALYAEKIEGIFATVFRQAAMYSFEQAAHRARRERGELTMDELGAIWHENLQQMFGASVKLGDQHRSWWSYVSHFFSVPFYVYAYSFGELLVLSLYQTAKKEGPAFADKYIHLLELGGSRTPAELMATVGIDLNSESFWKGGFAAMEALIQEFERLWGEVGQSASS